MLVTGNKIRESKFFPHSIHCCKKQLCHFLFPPALFVVLVYLRVIFIHFFCLSHTRRYKMCHVMVLICIS